MSSSAFHVDPDCKGAVVELLEEHGYEVAPGAGPMVDFTVNESEDGSQDDSEGESDGKPHFEMEYDKEGIHIVEYTEFDDGSLQGENGWFFTWTEVFRELIDDPNAAPTIV